MQTSRILHFKSKNIFQLFREGYSFLIMFIMYVIGITAGILLLKYYDSSDILVSKLFDISSSEKTFWTVFLGSFFKWMPYMLVVFIFGTCIVGVVVIPFLVCAKGIEYGLIAGYIYNTYSFNGIVYVLILIIPPVIIAAFGLFFTARNSFSFSLRLAKHVMPEPRADFLYPHLARYSKKFVALLMITVFASIIDASLSTAFSEAIKLV